MRVILTFILLCCVHIVMVGQSTSFYDKEKTGSQYINSFCQDKDNFLWIGTKNGLKRFDGVNFINYYHDDKDSASLSDNEVHTLLVDNKKNLWIGTATGLQCYVTESDDFHSVIFPNMNISRRITNIIQCKNGQLLCNVSGIGLFSFDYESMTAIPFEKKPYSPYISCILEDSQNRLWLGTNQGTIACINTATNKENLFDFPFKEVKNIIEGKDGRIYAVTSSMLATYDEHGKCFSEIPYYGNKKNISFWTATLSAEGDIMIGTYGQGLVCLKNGEKSIKDVTNIYNSFVNTEKIKINSIFEDKERNLWMGCDYQGILMLPHHEIPFHFWNLPITIDDTPGHINTIYCDNKNILWCAIEDNGIYQFNSNGHVTNHIETPSFVSSIFEDSKGNFWIGMNGKGLFIMDRKNKTFTLKYPIKGNFSVRHIEEDKHGNLYISILGKGILHYSLQTDKATMFSSDSKLKNIQFFINNWVTYIFCDSKERIWFGHFGDIGNVSCYDTRQKRFLELPFESDIKLGFCYAILEDNNHTIWMGTKKGLVNYNPETKEYSVITKDNGLPDNIVCGLAKDLHGNLWCSTTNGICSVNTNNKKINKYHTGNGLQDKIYLEGRCTTDKNGRIYFGGEQGITCFYPDEIKQVTLKDTPVITDLLLGGNRVNMQTISGNCPVIDKELVNAEIFKFSYTDNSFTFFISMMDYHDVGNLSYEYRLDKFGEKWSKTLPGDNRIQFNHLAPGNYTMQIRACENEIYSPIKSVRIHISQPWYLSTFAKIIYLLLIIGMGYLSFLSYRRKRKEQIGEMKLQFFINISHEIRSPLTLITNHLERLLKKENSQETYRDIIGIKHNTDRILNLINQLLDIQKIDKGKMNLCFTKTDMMDLANDIVGLFQEQAAQKNIQLKTDIPETLPEVWVDQNNFDKILVNLISNALKYTPQGGKINVSICTGKNNNERNPLKNYMEISVSDTGKGLNEKELNKIFERFYQGDANRISSPLGSGIGLNLCKLLVRLHHGTITAYNRQDTQGSLFVVRLPLGNEHLKKEEMSTINTQTTYHTNAENIHVYQTENETHKRRKTNYHVLIIDDDDELRNYLKNCLSTYYHVDTATDGAEGWKKAITNKPDLIISDVVMPKKDGIQLLKELKKNINTNHIPIILLTSQIEFSNRIEGLAQGADSYLSKPFKIDELITLTNNLITNRIILKNKYTGNQTQEEKIDPINLQGNDDVLLERIIKVINDNINNPEFCVEMLAQEAGLSRTHLHRKMKEITGLTTSDFIRNTRLRQAAELLKNGQSNIKQIAFAVGFSNQTHFSNAFKKVYGMSPTEYMDNAGNKQLT